MQLRPISIALCLVIVAACSSDSNSDRHQSYTAPVAQTGIVESYRPGDDGDWQAGVSWPEPRYASNANGTVTDNLTGLVWLKNLSCFSQKLSWETALDKADALADDGTGRCGLNDGSQAGSWRLPNILELVSLSNYGPGQFPTPSPFYGEQGNEYWSSTTVAGEPEAAWFVDYVFVRQYEKSAKMLSHHLWPVRDRQPDTNDGQIRKFPASLRKTGQISSYHPGDDGDWQAGEAWPDPRFTDNADGTVIDTLTGLIWIKDSGCFDASLWELAIDAVNALTDDGTGRCGLNDNSQIGDWRMANVSELLSLTDFGLPGSQLVPFLAVPPCGWSSTAYGGGDQAFRVCAGNISEGDTADERGSIWPVRSRYD